MVSKLTFTKYDLPPLDRKEVLRYMGAPTADDTTAQLIKECEKESADCFTYLVCFDVFGIKVKDKTVDFGAFSVTSGDLAKNLQGCKSAVIFAATVGVEIDRLIKKYSALSPAKSLCFQAVGNERIEALCDLFNKQIKECQDSVGKLTRPRLSAGYGDFALKHQKDIFSVLDCERQIGVTLSQSLLMTPQKSVTAVIGIKEGV
ncbi:MAG: Vitamin B12 dependent methionine synthase activation subunit [Oscillospiraceae bacterium]|nr:Vitamin B12 dependent methionine synthase activation subunit [Candidatus Equicaccousia limihippi]